MKTRLLYLVLPLFVFCSHCWAQEQCPKVDSNRQGGIIRKNIRQGASTAIAKNTYAVIINVGKDLESNRESYWNDCSFFYTALRNVYNVPRENISVIMSDGTDPTPDITLDGEDVLSSPLDLDGDGTDDIQYAATRENIKNVFDDLSNILTEKDQLLVFIVGHGGIDAKPYICLWGNDDNLYPDELAGYVRNINVGYMTFILGQCHSGGFERALKAGNRIILAACKENEKSWTRPDIAYDEFVCLFTSALAGVDMFEDPVDADYNGDGTVSLLEAYRYAEEHDGYNDGDLSFGGIREHHQVSYLAGSNAEDLSLSYVPNPVELSFAGTAIQKGGTPWDTEAVILSEDADGTDWNNANSDFSQGGAKTVSVKIRNRGVKPYTAADKTLALDWSAARYNFASEGESGDAGGQFAS